MFRIKCIDCGADLSTDTAKGMSEHANAVYSFVCPSCYVARAGDKGE